MAGNTQLFRLYGNNFLKMLSPKTIKKLPKTVHSPKDWSYLEMKVRMINDQLMEFHRFINLQIYYTKTLPCLYLYNSVSLVYS